MEKAAKKESEKVLEKNLRDKVKSLGGLALKFWSVSWVGFPDRIVLMPQGKIFFVELKSTGRKPTPTQAYTHNFLSNLGFKVLVIDSTEKLNKFLKSIEHAVPAQKLSSIHN